MTEIKDAKIMIQKSEKQQICKFYNLILIIIIY